MTAEHLRCFRCHAPLTSEITHDEWTGTQVVHVCADCCSECSPQDEFLDDDDVRDWRPSIEIGDPPFLSLINYRDREPR